ncbi:MAG TPA: pro-sigmaK processing inhibitor BofA family protein [Candidatus Borkfalkia avicola]|uniref:Pro-sigmaK processing inhibitor BofA family protein n=1 Tax=Candidatus Borkfalkia avicola TaxID=2838503 RepID=A0A9D2III6_9FIRM|nr:pro-sigmaK processing inhibitor BofA family protein [Candidatus Borkfalkia avicola]
MPETVQYILIALAAFIALIVVLKLFKVSFRTIVKVAVNAAVGIALIFLLNLIPNVAIPVNWWTALVSGIFGVPGVIVLLILNFVL